MASPHVPGKGWEEYSTTVDQEYVTLPEDPVEAMIHETNHAETIRRRIVGGHPQEHWYVVIGAMFDHGLDDTALPVLEKLMAAAESLAQYDTREPEPYWFERAAMIHRRHGEYPFEIMVLDRWLGHWPADRWRPNRHRDRILKRRDAARALGEAADGLTD